MGSWGVGGSICGNLNNSVLTHVDEDDVTLAVLVCASVDLIGLYSFST